MSRVAFLSDIHFDEHDKKAWPLALAVMSDLNLDRIILGGDIVEIDALSRFKTHPEKKLGLTKQLKLAKKELTVLREQFSLTDITYMEGNHETRMERYIHERCPELHDVSELRVAARLGLDDLDIEWVPEDVSVSLGKLNVIHGHQIKHTSAKSLYSKVSANLLCGHDHWFDQHIQRVFGKTIHGVWINGCLRNLTPDWHRFPQWHQGFTVVDVCDRGYFNVDQIMFLDRGKKLYTVMNGREYSV
jgi:predicted phosphodiesterase